MDVVKKESTQKPRWSDTDRRRFADGERLRAQAVPGKQDPGPQVDEWDDDDDWKDLQS